MVAGAGRLDLREDPLQGTLPQPAYGARGHPQPVVAAGHEALALELALQLSQRLELGRGARAEVLLQRLDVHVVEGRPGVRLGHRLLQRLQVGELGDGLDRVAVPERLAALAHVHRPPLEPGSQRPQVVRQLRHLRGEVGVLQRVAHQLAQLGALLRGQRRHHPVGRGLPPGQRVDQLVDVLGVLREQVAVLVHELPEPVLGVLPARVRREQPVEVGQHVLDRLHGLGVRVVERLLQAGELRVQHLPLQHLPDRVVGRAGLVGVPVVRRQGPHRAGRVVGDRRELHLGPPGVVVVLRGEGVPLLRQRLVERGADLVERAAEVAAPPRRVAHPPDPGGEVVEAPVAVEPPPQQVGQRVPHRPAGEHVAAQLVEGGPDVVRRGQRVGTVAPGSVAEPAHLRLRTPIGRPGTPCRCGG